MLIPVGITLTISAGAPGSAQIQAPVKAKISDVVLRTPDVISSGGTKEFVFAVGGQTVGIITSETTHTAKNSIGAYTKDATYGERIADPAHATDNYRFVDITIPQGAAAGLAHGWIIFDDACRPVEVGL